MVLQSRNRIFELNVLCESKNIDLNRIVAYNNGITKKTKIITFKYIGASYCMNSCTVRQYQPIWDNMFITTMHFCLEISLQKK